jgi:ankyrin repeat protein
LLSEKAYFAFEWSWHLTTSQIQPDPFRGLVEVIVSGDSDAAIRALEALPRLATVRATQGSSRQAPEQNFYDRIRHYMYVGDSALHMAAAAHQPLVVEKLIAMGADVRARNRRGAEPLHYAVDGGPGSSTWSPSAQAKIIEMLIDAGADPNAVDKGGVAPLHRAVRNRSASAVQTLIDRGADFQAPNRNGSTPMLLATQNTGKSGSGSADAKAHQQEILRLLKAHGAR